VRTRRPGIGAQRSLPNSSPLGERFISSRARAYTKDIRAAAAKEDRIEFLSLWAGQAARLGQAVPAAEVVKGTVREAARRLAAFGPGQLTRSENR
jgi:hypothetical protein